MILHQFELISGHVAEIYDENTRESVTQCFDYVKQSVRNWNIQKFMRQLEQFISI